MRNIVLFLTALGLASPVYGQTLPTPNYNSVTLQADPSAANQAARKGYVDGLVAQATAALNASALTSGTVPVARLPTGPGGVALLDGTGKLSAGMIPAGTGGTQLVIGTTAGTAAAGNDARIVGAAQASSLAAVATTGSYADLTGKPTIPPAPGLATASVAGLIKAGPGLTIAGDGTASIDGQAPVAFSGTLASNDGFLMVRGSTSYTVTLAQIQAAGGGGSAPAVPGQVTALSIGTPTSSSLPLTWTAPSTGGAATADTVEYRTTGSTPWTVATTAATGTSYTLTGLAGATGYDARVTATNAGGSGTPSAVATGTTAAAGGSTNTITFTGAAGPPSGNQVLVAAGSMYGGSNSLAGYALDGAGNATLPSSNGGNGLFTAFGSKPDGVFTVTYKAGAGTRDLHMIFRNTGSGATQQGYLVQYDASSGLVQLFRYSGGAFVASVGNLAVPAIATTLALTINGGTVFIATDNTARGQITDGSPLPAGGTVGIGSGPAFSPQTAISQVSYQ